MNRASLQTRLRVALRQVIVDEWSLFTAWVAGRPVSERTVCAHLAWYLRPQLPRAWDIDCEYNRNGPAAVKTDVDGNQHPADLIVHRRGSTTKGSNLLFVELKITSRSDSGGGSPETVQSLVRDLHYQDGVFLHLNARRERGRVTLQPEWAWFSEEDATATRPVYTSGTLATILKEAASANDVRR